MTESISIQAWSKIRQMLEWFTVDSLTIEVLSLYLDGLIDIKPGPDTIKPSQFLDVVDGFVMRVEKLRSESPKVRYFGNREELVGIEIDVYDMLKPIFKAVGNKPTHYLDLAASILYIRPEWQTKDIPRRIRRIGEKGWLARPRLGIYQLQREAVALESLS